MRAASAWLVGVGLGLGAGVAWGQEAPPPEALPPLEAKVGGWVRGLAPLEDGRLGALQGSEVVILGPGLAVERRARVCYGAGLAPAGPGRLAVACDEGVQVVAVATGKVTWAARWERSRPRGIGGAAAGSRVVVLLESGQVRTLEGPKLKEAAAWQVPPGGEGVAVSADGSVTVVSGGDGLWRQAGAEAPRRLEGTAGAKRPALHPDGSRVVAQGPGSFVASLRDAGSGASVTGWTIGSWLSDAAFRGEAQVALGGPDGVILGWSDGQRLEVPGERVEAVAWWSGRLCAGTSSGVVRCAEAPALAPAPPAALAQAPEQAPADPLASGEPPLGLPPEPPPEPPPADAGWDPDAQLYLTMGALLLGGSALGSAPLLALEDDMGAGEALLLGGVASLGMVGIVGGGLLAWGGLALLEEAAELLKGSNGVPILGPIIGVVGFVILWPIGFAAAVGGGALAIGGPIWTGLGMVSVDALLGQEPAGFWTPALAAAGGGLGGVGVFGGGALLLGAELETAAWFGVGGGILGATLTYALVREPEGGSRPVMVMSPLLTF